MISVTRLVRLGIRLATWATPHVKEWHRQRHLNLTEGTRHLESRNWTEAEKHLKLALEERNRSVKQRIDLLLRIEKAQRGQRKLIDAEQTVRQAIDLAAKAGDADLHAEALDSLADLQIEQAKYTEAEQTVQDIERLEQAQSNPDHRRLATCSRKLGGVLLKSNRPAEAMAAFERAAKLSEQVFGAAHLETAKSLSELGAMHQEHGNQPEAQRCIRRSLEIHRAQLGAESHEATRDLQRLAASLEESGDLAGAMGEYERVLTYAERQIGGDRHATAETQVRLGILYLHAGRASAARELLSQAVGVLERGGGERAVLAMEALAAAEEDSGRVAEASRWREKAASIAIPPA